MNKQRLLKICKWTSGILLGLVLLITFLLYLFKDDICNLVVSQVNKQLKAKVAVSEVDLTFWGSFPNLSVDFNHVFVKDTYEGATDKDTLLYTDQIRLKFNPLDIWEENYTVKKIEVAPGTLKLKINAKGVNNYDILKPSEDSVSNAVNFNLEEVNLTNFRFSYSNKVTDNFYSASINEMNLSGDFSEQQFTLQAESNLFVNQAKSGQVALIRNKPAHFNINIKIDQEKSTFEIPKARLYVSNLPFNINGIVAPNKIQFKLTGEKLQLDDVANHLSISQLGHVKNFQGTGEVKFDLRIEGKNDSESPTEVTCEFGVKNGELTEPVKNQRIKAINIDGKYSNVGGITKEFLRLDNIHFNTATGPFSGNLALTQFAAPRFDGNALGDINLSVINSLFPIPNIEKLEGTLHVNSNFIVQAKPLPNESLTYDIEKCEGNASFKDVAFQLIDDKRLFHSIHGDVYLRNDQAGLNNISLKLGSSDLKLDGVFENVVGYFKKDENLIASIEITGQKIDLADLGTTAKEDQIQEARSYMFPSNIKGDIELSIGELVYAGHAFELINTNMHLNDRKLQFSSLSFRNAGATITGNLSISETAPELFQTSAQLESTNLNLKSVFDSWNNFGQEVIRKEHIFGNAAVQLFFEAPFDLRSGVIEKAINSEVKLKVTNGKLKNVETFKVIIESLQSPSAKLAIGKENIKLLEKKLMDLSFETLENTLVIKNGVIALPEMKIISSALNVAISGTHTFKNDIDYRFSFRFRDLKAQKQGEFGNVVDDGTGINIYMRMHGNLNNPIIEWDKAAKKEDREAYNEQEKQNIKGILKQEFGLYKKDSTIQQFEMKVLPKEELKVEFGSDTTSVNEFNSQPPKDTKTKKLLDKWKKESQESKKEKFEIFD